MFLESNANQYNKPRFLTLERSQRILLKLKALYLGRIPLGNIAEGIDI